MASGRLPGQTQPPVLIVMEMAPAAVPPSQLKVGWGGGRGGKYISKGQLETVCFQHGSGAAFCHPRAPFLIHFRGHVGSILDPFFQHVQKVKTELSLQREPFGEGTELPSKSILFECNV